MIRLAKSIEKKMKKNEKKNEIVHFYYTFVIGSNFTAENYNFIYFNIDFLFTI